MFLSKVILKNPPNMWGDIAINEIKSHDMWDHPFVKIEGRILAKHKLVFIIINEDDTRIHDIGNVLTEETSGDINTN